MKKNASKNSGKTRSTKTFARGKLQPRSFHLEHLEQRHLLSAVPFVEGTIDDTLQDEIRVTLNASNAPADTTAMVQLTIQAADGSTLDPGMVELIGGNGGELLFTHANFNGTSAYAVARLVLNQEYTFLVHAEGQTTGDYTVLVQLAGDTDGDGVVSELELRHVEAAVLQANGFSGGLAKMWKQAYKINLYGNEYYDARYDLNSNGQIDANELTELVSANYKLTTIDGLAINSEVVTDSAAPEISNVTITDGLGVGIDTPTGTKNAWDGPWTDSQQTDLITGAELNADTGFLISGKLYDKSGITSAAGKFIVGNNELSLTNLLEDQGDYYTYNPDTYMFTLNVAKAFTAMGIAIPTEGFAEGEYILKVWGEDGFGNTTDEASAQITTIVIDRTAPVFELTAVDSPAVSNANTRMKVTFNKTGAQAGDFIQLWVRSSTQSNSEGTLLGYVELTDADIAREYVEFDFTALADGEHVFYARTIDLAGNSNETLIVSKTVRIDTAPPTITANLNDSAAPADYPGSTAPDGKYTLSDTADFSITAADASELAYTLYVDGLPTTAEYNSTAGAFGNFTLPYGSHTYKVEVVDAAGNKTFSNELTIYKNTAPVAEQIPDYIQAVNSGNTWEFDFSGYFSDADSGDSLSFSYTVSGEAVSESRIEGTTLYVTFDKIPEGKTKIKGLITITATDSDGEQVPVEFDVIFTKDNAPPTLADVSASPAATATGIPSDGKFYTQGGEDNNFAISGSVFDHSEILSMSAKLYYNGVGYDITEFAMLDGAQRGNPFSINVLEALNYCGLSLTELSDGEYILKIWGEDVLGNVSTEANPSDTFTFVLDSSGPETSVESLAIEKLYTTQPKLTITLSDLTVAETDFWVQLFLDGSSEPYATISSEDFRTANGVYEFTPGTLADGSHSFTAWTIDRAGNTSSLTSPAIVIVDTVAPEIDTCIPTAEIKPHASATNYTNDATTSFTVTATDANPVHYLLYAGTDTAAAPLDQSAAISDGTYTFKGSINDKFALVYGENVFTIVVKDEAGNTSESYTITVTRNTPPAIVGGKIDDMSISAREGTYTMEIDVRDFFTDEVPTALTYVVNVVDNETNPVLESWNYNSETGILTLVFETLAQGDPPSVVEVSITATDFYGEKVTGTFAAKCSLGNSAPAWKDNSTLKTEMFYETQAEESLNFDFSTLITDDGPFSELSFDDITISFGTKTYTVGTDPENNIIHNGGTSYTWTPPANYYGGGKLSVKVTDQGLEDGKDDNAPKFSNLEKDILVEWENYAPVLTLADGAVTNADVKLTRDGTVNLADIFDISDIRGIYTETGYATDPGAGQTITWAITGGSGAISLNTATGMITYDFDTEEWGEKTVSVTVSDGTSNSNTMTFTFNVYAVNHTPEGTADTVSFQVTGAPSQTWNLLANDVQTKDTWQNVTVQSVTVYYDTQPYEVTQTTSQTITVTHNDEEYSLTFSLSGGNLTMTVDGGASMAELEGLAIGFEYLLQDNGAFPESYPFTTWADGTDETDFAETTIAGNTIQFNAYASALTYNDFVANSHANDYHGPIIDILTKNEGNWGDKTFVLKSDEPFDIFQDGAKAGEAVVLEDGTLEIRLPGNAFGQYKLTYVLVNTADSQETASADITLNVKATNAEAPVYIGSDADMVQEVNEGGELVITLDYLNSLFSDYETPGQFAFEFEYTDEDPAGIVFIELDEESQSYIFTPDDGLWGEVIGFKIIAFDTAFGEAGNMSTPKYVERNGTITVNPVAVAPTVDSGSVTILDGKAVEINLNDLITDTPVDGVTYTFDVPDTITGGTLEPKRDEEGEIIPGVYIFTPAAGYVGATGFEFSVTATKSKGDFTDSQTTVGCQQSIIVAGTVHVTDKSLEVVVDSSSKSYARNETLTDSIYLDGTNSVFGLITINAGSKLLAGTTFTLSSSNYSEDEIAEMMQGLLYTRNGDVFTITAECTVVNDWGVEARDNTFVDGVQFSAGTTFGTATTLNIKTYSLNADLYVNPDAYLVVTDDSMTGITAVNYTLKKNSFIKEIKIVDGKLEIHYNVYSPTQDRTPQDITVTIAGVSEPVPVQITTDHVQPLQYYVRVVTESDFVTSDDGGFTSSKLYDQNFTSVAPGEKIYVEVWFQNNIPTLTELVYSQYKTWWQYDFLGLLATELDGINFDDLVFSFPSDGYSPELGAGWNSEASVEERENGFFAGDMSSMVMLSFSEIFGSGVDGKYARIGVLAIQLPEGQEGSIAFKPYTDGSVDYSSSLDIYIKDGSDAGLQIISGTYNEAQVKHNSFTVTVTNGAKIYGTESARETVVEGTGVYMTVSKEVIDETRVAELPVSEQWVTEWDSYYVNLWVNTQDPNVNLESLLFDLAYNANYITATGIEYTDAIDGLEVMYSADGAVIGIGGTLLADLTNEDGFVLIGRVKMESLAGDNVAADTVGSVKTGLTLGNIVLTDKAGEAVTPNTQVFVNTNVFAVVYDANDDGQIDIYDLIVFAKSYGTSTVNDCLDPAMWAIDFDNSGQIDIYDLIAFAKNYGAGQGGSQQIVYPEGFMQRWIGSQFLTEGDASVSEMLDVVIRQWQDALGEDFQLDVQIIVKDIKDDNTLGETVLVSLDDAGKPGVAVIYLDASALGLGWYVSEDATQLAVSGRYDLYTVLAHELGHALGFNPLYTGFTDTINTNGLYYTDSHGVTHWLTSDAQHVWNQDDLMYYQLDPGVRKEISAFDVEMVSKARETGGELKQVQALAILGEISVSEAAPLASVAIASTIVEQDAWTLTLETKVAQAIQQVQQQVSAIILAEDEEASTVAPVTEADMFDWLQLPQQTAATQADTHETAADLLLGDWENFLAEDNGADDLDVTL